MTDSQSKFKKRLKFFLLPPAILLITLLMVDFVYGKWVERQLEKDITTPMPNFKGLSRSRPGEKVVCLLIHGYCDAPATYKYLIEELQKQDYDYEALLLPGHGTTPKDLANKTWKDWYENVENSYLALKKKYEQVWVVGFSTGGTLALHLAESYPSVDGLVLIAPFLRCPKVWGIIAPEKVFRVLSLAMCKTKYMRKVAPAGIGDEKLRKEFVEYRYLPVSTTASLFELADITSQKLHQIQSPILILHGMHDRSSDPKMSQILLDTVASKDKKLRYFENSQHVVILDREKDQAIAEIMATLKRWKK